MSTVPYDPAAAFPIGAPEGWRADPNLADTERFWDGLHWTDETRPSVRPGTYARTQQALADRLRAIGARLLFTQDGAWRRGTVLPLKARADEALSALGGIEHTIVVRRTGIDVGWYEGDRWYHDLLVGVRPGLRREPSEADTPADLPLTASPEQIEAAVARWPCELSTLRVNTGVAPVAVTTGAKVSSSAGDGAAAGPKPGWNHPTGQCQKLAEAPPG